MSRGIKAAAALMEAQQVSAEAAVGPPTVGLSGAVKFEMKLNSQPVLRREA
jgi:hypothetical protein